MVGYTSRVPSTGEILNALTWESDLVARAYQPKPTFFERAAAAGVGVSSVALERFAGTGLTEAALRGADFVPFPTREGRGHPDRPGRSRPRSAGTGAWSTRTSGSWTTAATPRAAGRRPGWPI